MMNGVDACLIVRNALPKALCTIEREIDNLRAAEQWYRDHGSADTEPQISAILRRISVLYDERDKIEALNYSINVSGCFSLTFHNWRDIK